MQLCDNLALPQGWNFYLSVILASGIVISYAPQAIAIVKRGTIEGISPYYLTLMNLGSAAMLGNVAILSQPVFSCCRAGLTPGSCFAALLGLIQTTAAWLGPLMVLALAATHVAHSDARERNSLKRCVQVVLATNVAVLVTVLVAYGKPYATSAAEWLGFLATANGAVQYLPQLVKTWRLKHAGSLSRLTLLIQFPGGVLWCISLAARENSSVSTWAPIALGATCQALLFTMLTVFAYQRHQLALHGDLAAVEAEYEAEDDAI